MVGKEDFPMIRIVNGMVGITMDREAIEENDHTMDQRMQLSVEP